MSLRPSRSQAWHPLHILSASLAFCTFPMGFSAAAVHAQAAQIPAAESAYERGLSAYLEADFGSARHLLEQAIEAPSTSLEHLAASYALLAVLSETEGAPSAEVDGQIDFAVSIDRAVAAPPGVSRALARRFEAVRAARVADAPSIVIETRGADSVARLRNAPEGLVRTLQLRCDAEGPITASDPLEAQLHAPSTIHSCTAVALDAQGRALFREEAAYGIDLALTQPTDAPEDNTAWIVLGVVGGVLVLGGAITIGVLAASPGEAMLGAPTVTGWGR